MRPTSGQRRPPGSWCGHDDGSHGVEHVAPLEVAR